MKRNSGILVTILETNERGMIFNKDPKQQGKSLVNVLEENSFKIKKRILLSEDKFKISGFFD